MKFDFEVERNKKKLEFFCSHQSSRKLIKKRYCYKLLNLEQILKEKPIFAFNDLKT